MEKDFSSVNFTNRLISITEQIKDIYGELLALKTSGEENSKVFNSKLIELHNLLFDEKNIYDELRLNDMRLSQTKKLILSRFNKKDDDSLFNNIFTDEVVFTRIITKLNALINVNNNRKSNPPKIMTIDAPYLGVSAIGVSNNNLSPDLNYLKDSINYDILYAYLYFLEKVKSENYNKEIIGLINKEQFDVMLKFGINEMNILDNKLQAPQSVFLASKVFFQMEKISSETHEEFVNNFNSLMALKSLSELTEISDLDYLKADKVMRMIKLTSLIKASFVGINENNKDKIFTSYRDYLNEQDYKKSHFFNRRSEKIAMKSLIECKDDKVNTLSLSLIKRKEK